MTESARHGLRLLKTRFPVRGGGMRGAIESIVGIEPDHGEELRAAGVDTLAGLLEAGAGPSRRRALAAATHISQGQLGCAGAPA